MSNVVRWVAAWLIAFIAVGCAGQPRPGPTTAPSLPAAPAVNTTPPPSNERHEQFFTTRPPHEAAVVGARALHAKFAIAVGEGLSYDGFEDRFIHGDQLSGEFVASTTTGHTIKFDFEWVAEGKAGVGVTSNLPAAQFTVVMATVREALAGDGL